MRSVRLADAVIRLYPHTWRVRYEGELRAMLQNHPPSLGQLLDLLRGCGSEWGRVLSDPVAYPQLSAFPREAILGTMQIGCGLLFGLLVVATGELLRGWRPSPIALSGFSAATFVYLAVVVRALPAIRSRWTRYHIGVPEVWIWLAAVASSFVLERWIGGILFVAIDVIRVASCFWFLSMATPASFTAFETHRLLRAARLDEYGARLRVETAERHGEAADVEAARGALVDVHHRIRRHASELRQISLWSLIGLRKP